MAKFDHKNGKILPKGLACTQTCCWWWRQNNTITSQHTVDITKQHYTANVVLCRTYKLHPPNAHALSHVQRSQVSLTNDQTVWIKPALAVAPERIGLNKAAATSKLQNCNVSVAAMFNECVKTTCLRLPSKNVKDKFNKVYVQIASA